MMIQDFTGSRYWHIFHLLIVTAPGESMSIEHWLTIKAKPYQISVVSLQALHDLSCFTVEVKQERLKAVYSRLLRTRVL